MSKVEVLFDDIVKDIISCWNFVNYNIDNPPIDKRVAVIGIAVILLYPFFVISNESDIILSFARVALASIATLLILTWSNTFWFLVKKSWIYKIHVKKRKSINYYLKNIETLKVDDEEPENLEDTLYTISNNNSGGFKYHAIRNAVEVILLLILLLYVIPSFFLFNLGLIAVQFFWVMLDEDQSIFYAFNELEKLVYYVHKFYKENPKKCKKFIFDNKMKSVRELEEIYKAVEKNKL